ncbi:MAG: recombinase family protein [Lachnospiraceae bacterium]|nr:recombinase family protein [Lachnospiraceae bacterium]
MNERKVAIYARVSTEHEAQLSALDNQVQYYDAILQQHPEWKLYDRYVDEGITGTSTKKRKNFMRMIKDAEDGRFDLIITREVSRFARNTVDTLQETRKLKKIGIEVWFTEDNIWTMNDEDGELRLTIMATLAQNESKKTSQRVKAGQMISFKNAIPYGTGNILGYDRVGKEYVINPEQAETVKLMFKLYLEGYGIRNIQYELERQGRLTAMGLTNWSTATISHTLNNPFYCGTIVYRKEYVPDYLEQKKVPNHGEVEKIIVEGKHEPIISKEDFARVQEKKRTRTENCVGNQKGKKDPVTIWSKKLKCCCGCNFNRRKYHKHLNGDITYAYQCYGSIRSGTITSRMKKGLSTEGICEVPFIQEWKLELMAGMIFRKFWGDRKRVITIADEMLKSEYTPGDVVEEREDELKSIKGKLKLTERKLDNLLDLRLAGDIEPEKYNEKRKALEKERDTLTARMEELNVVSEENVEEIENTITVLKYILEQKCNFDTYNIPDEVIDAFVEEVIVYKDRFEWHLRIIDNSRESVICSVQGRDKKATVKIVDEETAIDKCDTGSYQRTLNESACFLGTFEISKEYMRKSAKLYYGDYRSFRFPEKLEFKLFLV